ncbi:hypothetical protein [uncultured Campylobacter sp.]|jgi:hypothetical protein|uniref:hypothetical protein n=1 Tax=uncultured Campylobacter sp. TaxID=218934 RepID=UPI0015BCD9D0|nr:hypothetical protein [uncultured Campylobacter sp.]
MKIKILLAFLFLNIAFANQLQEEMDSYDKIFEKIEEKRSGLSDIELSSIKNPFKQEPIKTTTDQNSSIAPQASKGLSLKAILLNRANIDSKWYAVGDIVDGYKIANITKNSVFLVKGDEKQELILKNGSKNVEIKIK